LFEALQNNLLQRHRNVGIEVARIFETGPIELQANNVFGGFARKRFLASQQFESGHSVSEEIDSLIDGLAQQLFG